MAAVLPLLPERHRAAPKPPLLWTLGVVAVAACAGPWLSIVSSPPCNWRPAGRDRGLAAATARTAPA